MASHYKSPPLLQEDKNYNDWKKEVSIWQIATDVKSEKQAAAIFMILEGKSRQAVLEMDIARLNCNDGVKNLMEKLDELWKEDVNQAAFAAYETFESFKRSKDMNVTEFINAFDRLDNRLKSYDMNLPEGVLAYRLLKSANLSTEQEQLAKATVTSITYKDMCGKLKSIFGTTKGTSGLKSEPDVGIVKTEPTYYNEQEDAFYGSYRGNRGNQQYSRRRSSRWVNRRNVSSEGNISSTRTVSSEGNTGGARRKNPVDSFGQVSRCSVCESVYHWMRDCPHREHRTPEFTMFTKEAIQEVYLSKLVGETFSNALLDSGCTKTVCGEVWLNEYLKTIPAQKRNAIQSETSNKSFKFGDGKTVTSTKRMHLPVTLGKKEGTMETEVVKMELPLLLSKEAMKKVGAVVDFSHDTAVINGEKVVLDTTSSGHYMIPLSSEKEEVLITINVETKSKKEKQRMAKKLHLQFGHPTHEKLEKLVKDAGMNDKEFIQELLSVADTCDTCVKYKRKNPRPIVGFSLAQEFNGTVAMDLKPYKDRHILHLIDLATRYSNAVFINNKRKETIGQDHLDMDQYIWCTRKNVFR